METIKDLLQKIYGHEYEMTISKTKGDRSMVRLDLKKELPIGYRIGASMVITPEFLVGAEAVYVGHAVNKMFEKMLHEEKLKTTYGKANTR